MRSGCCRMRRLLRFLSRDFLDFSDFTSSGTAGWAANRSLNFLFTVRTGTTRMRHRTMAECASARSDNGQNHAFPACCPGSCWAEPPINGGQNGWSLGHESFPGALRSSTPFALPSRALHHGVDNSRHRDLSRFGFALAFCCCLRFGSWANLAASHKAS